MTKSNVLCIFICCLLVQCQALGAKAPDAIDTEIMALTERIFDASSSNIFSQINVALQRRTYSSSLVDDAPAPLLTVNNATLSNFQTINQLRALFDNYELDTSVVENVTISEKREEDEFLEKVLDTQVMKIAMNYLKQKGKVRGDHVSQMNLLRDVFFTIYSRGGGRMSSCGFEHVFMSELKNSEVSGLHNWIYFNEQENGNQRNLDYKGYLKTLNLGNKGQIIKYRFSFKNINKPVNSMFVGTLPEMEMALYTVCLQMRKMKCDVSMGGKKFVIRAYPYLYRGKRMIGSAFPEI